MLGKHKTLQKYVLWSGKYIDFVHEISWNEAFVPFLLQKPTMGLLPSMQRLLVSQLKQTAKVHIKEYPWDAAHFQEVERPL